MFVVTEPGKRPAACDTAQTVLAFPDETAGELAELPRPGSSAACGRLRNIA